MRKTKVPSLDLDLYSLGEHIDKLRKKQESRSLKERIPHRDPADQADEPGARKARESFFD